MLKRCSCHLAIEVISNIGLKEILREEDNLSTKDNWPLPNLFFLWKFYCNNVWLKSDDNWCHNWWPRLLVA